MVQCTTTYNAYSNLLLIANMLQPYCRSSVSLRVGLQRKMQNASEHDAAQKKPREDWPEISLKFCISYLPMCCDSLFFLPALPSVAASSALSSPAAPPACHSRSPSCYLPHKLLHI